MYRIIPTSAAPSVSWTRFTRVRRRRRRRYDYYGIIRLTLRERFYGAFNEDEKKKASVAVPWTARGAIKRGGP